MFLERRRAVRRAVNLEDDHHSTNKHWKFVLTKQTGNKELKNKTNNMFVTRRQGQTRAVCSRPGLWLRRADGGAKTLEDDITLPTRILVSLHKINRVDLLQRRISLSSTNYGILLWLFTRQTTAATLLCAIRAQLLLCL